MPTLAPPPIPETTEEQRARILRQNTGRLTPTVYDDVYSLGYEPESWDGMWRIPDIRYPVLWLTSRWALVREVVEEPGSHRAEYDIFGRQRRRWVLQRVVR